MRVYKDLFGDGSKINASEIAVTPESLLEESVIVETGSNPNGSYVRFGNGIQICVKETYYEGGSGNTSQYEDLPVEFVGPAFVWGSAISKSIHNVYNMSNMGFVMARDGSEVRMGQLDAYNSDGFGIILFVFGFWK